MAATVMYGIMQAVAEGERRLSGGHHDAYLPVQGGLFESSFEPWLLGVVTVLVIGLGSLAAGAGIGGGGLFVPLFAFVLGVGAKAAVPMSKATILGGALGNMLSVATARHPDPEKNRPLIDYEASSFMQSGELLGVIFGVLLNMVLPEIAIIVFLALLLSFNGYKTITKGISKYKEESEKLSLKSKTAELHFIQVDGEMLEKKPRTSSQGSSGGNHPAPTNVGSGLSAVQLGEIILEGLGEEKSVGAGSGTDSTDEGLPVSGSSDSSAEATDATAGSPTEALQASELQKVIEEESAQFPLWSWSLLAAMTTYTIVYALAKKNIFSTCQPASYWLWYFSPVPVLGGFMYLTARILKQKHQRRVRAGYKFKGDDEEKPAYRDMKWTDQSLTRFPSIALLAGVSAGLLGIGGGMVIGPLFIQLDMQPKVGSSSCAFMILWTAVSGVIQYVFAGKIGVEFIAYGIAVGFISGQLGQRLVDGALRKTGRPSYVIFLLGGIVSVACVSMTTSGIVKVIDGIMSGDDLFSFELSDFQCQEGGGSDIGH